MIGLSRLLKIRSGEGRTAGLGIALMVFTAAGSAFGQSATDGLFFAHAGADKLPVMLIIAGGLLFVTSIIVTALLGLLSRRRLFLMIPLISAATLLIERALVATVPSWIYPVLWLTAAVVVLLQWLFTWGLLGIVVDTRQAKRLFPLFGAGAILGVVIGGLLTRPLADLVGAENLLFVWAACLAAASLVGRALVGRSPTSVVVRKRSRQPKVRPLDEMQQGARFVRASTVMRWMSLAAILFSVLYFSLYLPFSRAATVHYPSADALAGFFGLFSAVTTAAALITSLFLTNRMTTRFGVTTMLLVLALIYLVGFGVLIVNGTFITLVVIRFVQMLWSQAVANPAWEAVINIVPPARRDQTRAFLNGGPTQLGTMIAGLIQLIGLRRLSPIQLYAIGSGTAALLTFAMWKVGRAYSAALIDALRAGRPQVFPTVVDDAPFNGRPVDAAAVAAVIAGASDQDARVRRAAAEILGDLPVREAGGVLIAAVRDPDATVRATALRSLARAGDAGATSVAAEALVDPEPAVRLAAIQAVETLPGSSPGATNPIRDLLADPEPAVRAMAASAILRGSAPDEGVAVLRAMLEDRRSAGSRGGAESARRITDRRCPSRWAPWACRTPTHASGLPRLGRSRRPIRRDLSHRSCVRSKTTSATCGARRRVRSVGSGRRPWSLSSPPSSIPHRQRERSSRLRSCRRAPHRTSCVGTRERRRPGRWPTSARGSPSIPMEMMPSACSAIP